MLAAVLLAAVACTPIRTCTGPADTGCATPTPVLQWDAVADLGLAGYRLFRDGAALADVPCWYLDTDADGVPDQRICPGADFGIPVQRYCADCQPFVSYNFQVKAYTIGGHASADLSNVVPVCFSRICARPGPCN